MQLKNQQKIVYFSLAEEMLQEMALPDDTPKIDPQLGVLKGCLCVAQYTKKNRDREYDLNFWVMKEYGIATSWTKLVTIPPLPVKGESFSSGFSEVFYCIKNIVVFVKLPHTDAQLVFYDIETKETKIVEISNSQTNYCLSADFTFVESLVSPNL